jgi:hypothetical protein
VSTPNDMAVENANAAPNLAPLRRAAQRAERRERFRAALMAAARVLPVCLALLAPLLAFMKLRPSVTAERMFVGAAGFAAAIVLGVALRAAWRRRPALAGAIELDRHHALGGRIANALAFARMPAAERTPLMQLAMDDAARTAPKLDPRRAVPIALPPESGIVVLLAAGLFALSLFEVQTMRVIPPPPAPPPLLMSADDVELFRDLGEELARASKSPAQQAAVGRYNKLVEDIAEHRIDRHEVFRRLAEIERDLGQDLEADREALEEGLEGVARELASSPLTRKTAEALADKRLEDAEKALRELAEKLKNKQAPASPAELERLRKALERASKESQGRHEAIEQRRRELQAERESLLKKKNEKSDAGAKPDTEKKLEENKRKLEHLERQKNRAKRSAEQMSELDRELAQAAADLQKEMSKSGESLERGAQDINRMARQKLDEQQKRELLQRLREMREVLRQDSQGGDGRKQRMERFGDKARGQRPGEERGQGKDGKGGKGQGRPEIRLGRGETMAEIPGGKSGGQSPGKPGGESGGDADKGSGWGSGHDPNLAGKQTKLDGQTQDVSAAGIDSGEGTASAEVIYGAAERGFRGKGYKDIFTEYETVAEQVLEKDDIPSGYRFYVRRYFQLIRPRE